MATFGLPWCDDVLRQRHAMLVRGQVPRLLYVSATQFAELKRLWWRQSPTPPVRLFGLKVIVGPYAEAPIVLDRQPATWEPK
jgi:hypothetical protein